MKKPDAISIIAVGVVLFVILGGMSVQFGYPGQYSAEGTVTPTGADFNIESSISTEYAVVAIDNKSEVPVSKLYIFIDSDYVPYCASASTADYQVTLFEKNLLQKGFSNYERVDSDELYDLMSTPSAVGMGIYIPFGTLPDTVYTGNPSDKFTEWTSNGGTVYWTGGVPGKYTVSEGKSAVSVSSAQVVFPFIDGINNGGLRADQPADMLCSGLSLRSSSLKYSLSPEYPGMIGMGMQNDEGRCTISSVKVGAGTFFLIAGDVSSTVYNDVSLLIASGVTYGSEVVSIKEGTVKGQVSGSLEYSETDVSVYVLYGGYFPIYGKRIIG